MIPLLGILTTCSLVGSPSDCIPPMPPLSEMPLLTTWYDPALGGINCGGSCSHMALAPVTEAMYGYAAACPAALVGVDFTAVISHPAIGERACLDRGGAVIVEYSQALQTWIIRVDLLETGAHSSNWTLLYGWSVRWERPGDLIGVN